MCSMELVARSVGQTVRCVGGKCNGGYVHGTDPGKHDSVSCNVRTERDRNLCAMHVVFRFVSSLLRTARTCDTSGGVPASATHSP